VASTARPNRVPPEGRLFPFSLVPFPFLETSVGQAIAFLLHDAIALTLAHADKNVK
jgi:hypothetical protein